MQELIELLKFDEKGLIPAIVQDAKSGKVLMMAYMNQEALSKTLETGKTWFYSRSRQKLWNKGETSGHYQFVRGIYVDCDNDCLLIQVEQQGVACHTGFPSCFHRPINDWKKVGNPSSELPPYSLSAFLSELFEVIKSRKTQAPDNSYTAKLFKEGKEKILRKVSEETTEVILASLKNQNSAENKKHLCWEVADLLYHVMVLLCEEEIEWDDVLLELQRRRSNKKKVASVNAETLDKKQSL
ncbi:bifunctional phosphoribosyl-AMP cyclohydrolase/phosphoribosyl-ATP diphosphatase HisIE [Atrimonas thermophila]|jgi:phosphoribosyl-ATP pyrophosphohydrolase/phosphoribosyl-AMP cyclohydrolase|uniref:bifunctional phosphoribosyl-AMP cyclohydrolase/phosphoribosyl-ATP diphosphatase HisIE n=1 Tax=Atrimonas thermophila TaxID=3064161 RepID=UPI00399CA14C